MDLMEVDGDLDANQSDPDDDELDEFETLDATTGPGEPPKIPTPPPMISKKQKRDTNDEPAAPVAKDISYMAKTVTGPAFSTPVVNVTFGNEFASLFKANHTAPNTTATEIGPVLIFTSSLIPPSCKPGNDISIMAFCALYQLDDSITTKFASHSFIQESMLTPLRDLFRPQGDGVQVW
ncbi:hypothetical protein K503DRAFT_869497 [Rhizopogon vinicolor AM-OR11-026]|uniref:Uncharacterized protein n=1 Tax=Rhizopogon vinicolor AM-OR11-026 TaxID=1314800 RepID=A0A1B7MLR9_9AGAM|nr:hypothetical protein K503DRAFT_869497 [Rhizopogon vinicolor AM-OR11-026]